MPVNQVHIGPSDKAVVILPIKELELRDEFEERVRVAAVKRSAWPPSDPKREAAAPLGGGRTLRMFFLGRRGQPSGSHEALPQAPRLFTIRKNETTLDVRMRGQGYMPLHALVIGDGSQNINHLRLELTLELLRGLGPNYTGLFNRAGLTRDSFHAQVFQGVTPLRHAIQSPCAASHWEPVAKHVDGAILRDWPASAVLLRGPQAEAVAQRAVLATQRLSAAGLTYDLCFHFAEGEFWVVVFARKGSSDDEWPNYSPLRKELGKFGALEFCGIIVCVREEQVFRSLAQDPRDLSIRYENALAEMGAREVLDILLGPE